jgi:hypothetical protein
MIALRPYYDNIDKMRCCPEAVKLHWEKDGSRGPGQLPFRAWGYRQDFFNTEDYGSYGVNGWMLDAGPNKIRDASKYWRSISSLSHAEQIPLMLDAQWIDAWPEPASRPPNTENEEANLQDRKDALYQMVRVCQNRHRGYEGVAFMDASARKVGLKELWKLKWHRSYNTNGKWTKSNNNHPNWPGWMKKFKDY